MPEPTSRTTAKKAAPKRPAGVDRLIAEASATDPVLTWDWAGETFTLLRTDEPDMRILALHQSGQVVRCLLKVLGDAEATRLLNVDTDVPLTRADMDRLIGIWITGGDGADLGE